MKQSLVERRLLCLKRSFSGVKVSEWCREVAAEYGVSENTVRKDWARRARWLPALVNLPTAEGEATELVARLKMAMQTAFKKLSSNNESVQVGAARTVGTLSSQLYQIGIECKLYPSLSLELLDKLVQLEEEVKVKRE